MHVCAVTEIQNIQVAEGDLMRALAVPLYMVFPRLFSCPTLHTPNFKIGLCPPLPTACLLPSS